MQATALLGVAFPTVLRQAQDSVFPLLLTLLLLTLIISQFTPCQFTSCNLC